MKNEDYYGLLESMETGTLSINKANINLRLNANTSIIAATNSIYGEYRYDKSFYDNIPILPQLISRFDFIFIINNTNSIHNVINKMIDNFINKNDNNNYNNILLKKYIRYAKDLDVNLDKEILNKLGEYYIKLKESSMKLGNTSGIIIDYRHFASLVRMVISHTKLRLKNKPDLEDVDGIIKLHEYMLNTLNNVKFELVEPSKIELIRMMISNLVKIKNTDILDINDIINECVKSGQFDRSNIDIYINELINTGILHKLNNNTIKVN
jgi:DNA replicative helicase MCM subunit Mcm2 (Cdc46/Mcm family)